MNAVGEIDSLVWIMEKQIRSYFLAKPDLVNNIRQEFETASLTVLRIMTLRMGQKVLDEAITDFLSRRGIACFSEK